MARATQCHAQNSAVPQDSAATPSASEAVASSDDQALVKVSAVAGTATDEAADERLRKRLKHREYVKRSYRKKIATIRILKDELETLERQYSELLVGQQQDLTDRASISDRCVTSTPQDDCAKKSSPLLRRYMELANLKAQFQRENAELYVLNAECMKAESRLQQLLDAESQQSTKLDPLAKASLPSQPRFYFTSLSDAEYAKIIATSRDDILKFVYDTEKLSTGSRVFGWTDQRKIVGDELKFALEKEFATVSAHELQARSWPIFSTPERFAKIYSPSLNLKFFALQRINDDTHLFHRTVRVDGSDTVAKTVFLLARIRIERGYMVIFRAINPLSVAFKESEFNEAEEEAYQNGQLAAPRRVVWVDKYSWVIFQEKGPESCLFHFGGSTLSNLWLKEVLFIALRWEAMTVGPQIVLTM